MEEHLKCCSCFRHDVGGRNGKNTYNVALVLDMMQVGGMEEHPSFAIHAKRTV